MMSNTTSNKYKITQSIKVDKENENIELQKRMRCSKKDKYSQNKKETVWDRLSKVKKMPSTENSVGITRSRQNLHRFQATRQKVGNHPNQLLQLTQTQIVGQKPLSRNSSFINRHTNAPKKIILSNTTDNPEISYVCKPSKSVKEIMTPRSLRNSKSSSDDNISSRHLYDIISPSLHHHDVFPTGTMIKLGEVAIESQTDSNDEYQLAPLMNSHTNNDSNSSIYIIENFCGALKHKNKSMAFEDIELVKDVIKSDHRHNNLHQNDPKLFKEILKTQLQDILKHEFAVKRALAKLESSASLQISHEIEPIQPTEELVSYTHNINEPQKFEVDVIFKNVPSLEKEIIILRALGEKLEATLRSSSSHRDIKNKTHVSVALNTGPSLIDEITVARLMVENKHTTFVLAIEHYAEVMVESIGLCHFVGIAQEFFITQKTIDQLQQEDNHPFYIPGDMSPTAELKETSFKKLKENPDILLLHIKAKNFTIPFNVLEQDPVFFSKTVFSKSPKISLAVSTKNERYIENKTDTRSATVYEGGDSRIWPQTDKGQQISGEDFTTKNTLKEPSQLAIVKSKCKNNIEINFMKPMKLMDTPISRKHRRHIRLSMTPMPINKCINPKNALLKTILIGSVQMYLFILLIMAFTYPDPKC